MSTYSSTFVRKNRRSGRLHWLLQRHSWLGPGIWSSALYSALAGICAVIRIRSLVWARYDGSLALCIICGVYSYFRQKNIRTKDPIECSNVCSSELDIHYFIQWCHLKDIRGITLLVIIGCQSWLGPGIWSSALYSALAGICIVILIRSLVLARDDAVGGTVQDGILLGKTWSWLH